MMLKQYFLIFHKDLLSYSILQMLLSYINPVFDAGYELVVEFDPIV